MTSDWQFVITGCGTSHGNPPWGHPELWSTDPRDHRRRSGAMIFGPANEVILIDGGPDLGHQLRDPFKTWDGQSYPEQCVTRCDGLLLTHEHADHTHGMNELRHLNRLMGGSGITLHGHRDHLAGVSQMYPYCFSDGRSGGYSLAAPLLTTQHHEDGVPFSIAGMPITTFALDHGPSGRVSGFRIGNLAYCTDCKVMPEESYAYLEDCDILVLDMLREEPHVSHFNWQEAQAVIELVQPPRTVLVHMGYEVHYREWQDRLPAHVEMAYDGWHATIQAKDP